MAGWYTNREANAETPIDAPLAFSTMGCPEWSLQRVFRKGREYGFRGVELRGIRGEMDLTKLAEFANGRRKATLREAHDSDLRILNLCASTLLHESDNRKLQAHMDEAHRFIDLAHQLGVPYVRVFPGRAFGAEQRELIVEQIGMNLRKLGEYAKGSGVTVLLESHPGVSDSKTLSEILRRASMPDVGVLWDTGHTFGDGHEQPAETYGRLKRYVRLAQFIDFVPEEARFVMCCLATGKCLFGKQYGYSGMEITAGTTVLIGRSCGTVKSRSPKSPFRTS
jgi:sugar phosphate isomerase/epimerase